ncbi:MAG: hypothetical protein H6Q04_3397 [Acidobacteria bacterium]|nr:hypothetical protein [Acidobacteriota bacterium]
MDTKQTPNSQKLRHLLTQHSLSSRGLLANLFGEDHDSALLDHIYGRARLEPELQGASRSPAQRLSRRDNIRVSRIHFFIRHRLSPAAMSVGIGPELSYKAQLFTMLRKVL